MSLIAARRVKSRGLFDRFTGMDQWLNFATLALLGIGAILVYAATKNWYQSSGLDPQYYLKRHLINVVIGLLISYGVILIDYRAIRAYAAILYILGIFGLTVVLIPGLGSTVNGAKSWITLPLGFQFQPAELAKISVILGMALIFTDTESLNSGPSTKDVLKALGLAAAPMLLIILEPDLGEVLILVASMIAIVATSGAKPRWVVGLLLLGIFGSVVAVKAGVIHQYQLKRLQSFVNPTADPQQSGYQLRQARITIGSGGLLGKGIFHGPQTNGRFVPEQQTDFIFTVAGEELGFVGSTFILLLYGLFFSRAFIILRRTGDLFGKLVCVGVIAWFAFQIFQNIGMAVGLMPLTGVPLPFISYGGSSMFANLIGFGLLQNVHLRSR
jgi:rod shape determining protein RodA